MFKWTGFLNIQGEASKALHTDQLSSKSFKTFLLRLHLRGFYLKRGSNL